jgi:signal transduction histidine kinase
MIELEVTSGVSLGCRLTTNLSRITIGRSPATTLVIPDSRVSWYHGEIIRRDAEYEYLDLRSRHGSSLRRSNVDRPLQEARLKEGDIIFLAGGENAVTVLSVTSEQVAHDNFDLTLAFDEEQLPSDPADIFFDDAQALKAIVDLDQSFLGGARISEATITAALVEHVASLYPELEYVAVFRESANQVYVVQSLEPRNRSIPRKSSRIARKLREKHGGFVFEILGGQLFSLSRSDVELLSPLSITIDGDTSGICVPLLTDFRIPVWLQLERVVDHGRFTKRDLDLVRAMAFRAGQCLNHLDLNARYLTANQEAALGLFASNFGHDLKNALIFAPFIRDWLKESARHAEISSRVEHAFELALALQGLEKFAGLNLGQFSLNKIVLEIARKFTELFGGAIRLDPVVPVEKDIIVTGCSELVERIISILVFLARSDHERDKARNDRYIRIRVESISGSDFRIMVEDNAGGLFASVLQFTEELFELVNKWYEGAIDMMTVVEHMQPVRNGQARPGVVSSTGLFFCAVAVNEMGGTIDVKTTPGKGNYYEIKLPKRIQELKRLLSF